jgi:diguanylate cyclase (GGDEF)-like protein
MLGGIKDIPAIIKRYDVGIILSTTPVEDREVNEYISDLCQMHNLRLIFLKDLMLMVNRQVTQPIGSFEYPVYLDGNLEFKAMHDTITGLPNAYFFFDRIKRSIAFAKRYHSRLAVLFVKIEKENITTDKLEPEYGDTQILIEVAKRLAICERGGDTLAYVGKNKFAIILENISYQNTPEVVARSIRGLLSEPIKVEELDIRIHIYINICLDTKGYGDLEAMCKAEIEVNDIAKQKAEVLPHYDIALGK